MQRSRRRGTSLDASAPQRMTGTARAIGAWCKHFSQDSQSQGVDRCRSPSVGLGPDSRFMGRHSKSRRPRQVQPLDLVGDFEKCASFRSVRRLLCCHQTRRKGWPLRFELQRALVLPEGLQIGFEKPESSLRI